MKILSFAALILVSFIFTSCKSSTETNGPLKTYSLVKPKVGSVFVYQQELLDSNGNVRTNAFQADSIWRVVAQDTSISGHSHVWLFRSSTSDSDLYYERTIGLSFLDNGDFDFAADFGVIDQSMWLRMPLQSGSEQHVVLDTMIAPDSSSSDTTSFRVHETVTTTNAGTSDYSLNGNTYQAVTFVVTLDGIATSLQGQQLADIHEVDNWTFIPALGFFAKHDMTETGHDLDGRRNADGERMALVRYELK